MNFRSWLVAFLTTVVFILVKGYTFNCGDQEEHLPQVYQMINPSLYPKDYFMTAYHQTFTVRFFFVWLIYLFHFIMPVSLTCFLFHLLCVTVTAWAVQQMALHFKVSQLLADCSAFFAIVIFNRYTIGGNALMDTQLACGSFAAALSTLAFYYMLKKQWYIVAFLAGLASLFQVLVGLQVMIIIGFVFLVMGREDQKKISPVKFLLVYLLVASPMLFPIMYIQFTGDVVKENTLFYEILYCVRNPNHYLPTAFPLGDYYRFFSLTIVAGIFHFYVDKRLKLVWRSLFFIVIAGMGLYTFLLEIANFMPIGKLQWFKVTGWMLLINVLVIIAFVSRLFEERLNRLTHFKVSSFILAGLAIAGLIIITNSSYLPQRLQNRYYVGNYPETDLGKMHEWIRTNTPVDCLILTDPDNYWFLCEAQRSMPIGWKAIIHEPFFMIPWYEKFILAYHEQRPFKGFNVLEQATDHYNKYPPLPSSKLTWDFRLADLKQSHILEGHEILWHRIGNFGLLKTVSK